MDFLPFLSGLFGWVYTVCWSLSFYPQPMLNFRRRSTSGTTVDFPLINCLGFLAYLCSNAALYYSPLVRHQYALRNKGLTPTVQFNDLTFAAHALVLSIVTTSQYIPRLWGFPRPSGGAASGSAAIGRQPSVFVVGIMAGSVLAVGIVALVVATQPADADPARGGWCALDLAYAASYVKLLVTLVKYTPQVVANARNRSTKGWSIYQILLDVAGGSLSIAQLGIDSYLQGDWSGVTGNPVKLALGNVSMAYDAVFIVQHYVLYGDKGEKGARADDGGESARGRTREQEQEGLLDGRSREERRLD